MPPRPDDDLSKLEQLDEDHILQALRRRNILDNNYTYIGDILIAVNPCKPVRIYEEEHHETYKNVLARDTLPPHPFWVADRTTTEVLQTSRNQCILVSGESGAGKTETTKHILSHLVHLAPNTSSSLLDKIVKVNPLLEAFGNASTSMNTNSSRFGKFIELFYRNDGSISGAKLHDYLLEKSRVIHRSPGEKNFHVFYSLFAGMSEEKLLYYYLQRPDEHRILSDEDGSHGVFGSSEEHSHYKEMFLELMDIMTSLGLTDDQISQIFLVLASILHVSNLSFVPWEETGGVKIADEYTLHAVANLLSLDNRVELAEALISSVHFIRGERIQTFKTTHQANDSRDALAKTLYLRLFGWLVGIINQLIRPANMDFGKSTVGILDMAGFENFQTNRFEQFLINASNERLQQYFVEHIFPQERRQYELEGLKWTEIDYPDNEATIKLIFEKPHGMLPLLDDETNFPQSSDETYIKKLDKLCDENDRYISSLNGRTGNVGFGVKHFAEQVWYDADGFLEKNRDSINSDLLSIIMSSKNHFIADLFVASMSETGTISGFASTHKMRTGLPEFWLSSIEPKKLKDNLSRKASMKIKEKLKLATPEGLSTPKDRTLTSSTLSKHFKRSLGDLMTKLSKAEPLFIRCIKPNPTLTPGRFDDKLVLRQLQYNGLRSIAQLRRSGYPVRIKFEDFNSRYECLGVDLSGSQTPPDNCESVLLKANITGYALGRTKVFLKLEHREKLDALAQKALSESHLSVASIDYSDRLSAVDEEDTMSLASTTRTHASASDSAIELNDLSSTGNGSTSKLPAPSKKLQMRIQERRKKAPNISIDTRQKRSKKTQPIQEPKPYDVFQNTEREVEDAGEIWKNILKVLRLIVYVILLVALFLGAVSIKVSLLLLASQVKKSWLIEMLHTLGVCILVFRILPSTTFLNGIIICLALCQVPAFLKVMTYCKRPNQGWRGWLLTALNLVALLVQVAAIPFFMLFNFLNANGAQWTDAAGMLKTFSAPSLSISWELPVAILCISLSWWENFVADDWEFFCGKLRVPVLQWKITMHETRDTTYMLVGPFKIGFAVLLAHLFVEGHVFLLPNYESANLGNTVSDYFSYYGLMYINIGCGFICTYLAGMACKLHMQAISFALPLMLAPAGAVTVVLCQCYYQFMDFAWYTTAWLCPERDLSQLWIPLTVAGVLWLSNMVILSHIWFPQNERMAKLDRMFVMPNYDGILTATSLMMRRRRDDKESWLMFRDRIQHEETVGYMGDTPMIYVCATMWHETRREMTQLLKSLFRLDYVHCASRIAQEQLNINDPDYYDLEVHIIFDDAFEDDDESQSRVPNGFVRQLCDCIPDAASSVAKGAINIPGPERCTTPYGGRLTWTMPGNTKMIVHMKDKNKIRHRKRWSQVMYMYYLLGFHLLGTKVADKAMTQGFAQSDADDSNLSTAARHRKRSSDAKAEKRRHRAGPISSMFRRIARDKFEKAENTFILTLDGDVDFKPDAVKLLLDRMKKNKKVGAVCGRIHPIGSGPMVWYQQFEYSVGHWLQKAAEHVFGCVLCCPGCFSLFRGSALMDDNVMKTYTTKPTEATHYIQFEQGEDRWLCTLLLQQGHRIDYCAGADALTFAPETFEEFFNQRRRWSPSTMANQVDLLSSWRPTVQVNDNISKLYILYQFVLMASTILAPSTVVLVITGSFFTILKIGIWPSYALAVLPVLFFTIICMKCKTKTQLNVAGILSALYTVVMVIVTVGTIFNIVKEEFSSPNVVFLTGMAAIFLIAGSFHPQEFTSLIYGILYFLTVPSTFILLTVFYLCNMHNVSWGTRELPKKMTAEELADQRKELLKKQERKRNKGILGWLGLGTVVEEVKDLVRGIMKNKDSKSDETTNLTAAEEGEASSQDELIVENTSRSPVLPHVNVAHSFRQERGIQNVDWTKVDYVGRGRTVKINSSENDFWVDIIGKYLHPIDEDKGHQQKIKDDLISLRNNVVFAFMLVNFLWTVITIQLQVLEDEIKGFFIEGKYEPLSLLFLAIFAFILLLQFLAMFAHRWGTFLHLMSSTHIDWFRNNFGEEDFVKFALEETRRLATVEPEPDCSDDVSDDDSGYREHEPVPRVQDDNDADVPQLQKLFERNIRRMTSRQKKKAHFNEDPSSPVKRNATFSRHSRKISSKKRKNQQYRLELINRSVSMRNPANQNSTVVNIERPSVRQSQSIEAQTRI
ncbi:uncharacterized protein LOC135463580 isoform X2 [Liolophura sinensis]|uniref:uncharacterized protein LOC135463580 isoform X2 n=1 Tax=Liolophura sinensis TaxID=3198878 RepID=UPI0031592D22